jgi:hypothetical protein
MAKLPAGIPRDDDVKYNKRGERFKNHLDQ